MILIISLVVSFLTTLAVTPFLIKFFLRARIVAIDQHKKNKPVLPSAGGICVALGILAGLLVYVGLSTFISGVQSEVLLLLSIISSVLIVTLVGLFDDLNVSSKKVLVKNEKDIRIGLPQWAKPLLTLPAAVPLMVISAGDAVVELPFVGFLDLGIFYPLLIIPIGFVGASNAINMLGGFNGAEAGMGIVYMLALGVFSLLTQNTMAVLFLISALALIGFIVYNWNPAKILPGDSLTYLLGALIASGVVIGNMEKLGIFLLIPFIIELILKLRSRLKASSLGKLRSDGKLDSPYGKNIYSITHLIMNLRPFTERQVTVILIGIQLIVSIVGVYLVYYNYI